ncbi:two-component regulator propeller domain-containing protein [Bacteroides sp. AN502(2024)]|uniref:hybrid sensor histidine kinase/response regulator transcription factor n=1 Tax=Bacteroides sp. AN502(2024) TaxID=3160599 RepID=UPI0035134184
MKLTKVLICLLGFWTGTLFASPYFSFKKYQVEDGLSHNTVWCALQDSYGFVWLGTSDGLNRYDGRGNKVYRNVLNEKFSLENNFVEALIEVDHNIWVGTNSGLYIYDRDTDCFSYFDKTTQYGVCISSEIKKIIKTENGLIWIATLGQGFFIYDPKTEALTQNSIQTSFVWDLCQSVNQKRVYISSLQEGLLCFDENGKFLRTYEISLETDASDSYRVNCILNVDGEIWIGAGNNLLSRLDERTGAIDNYSGSVFNFGAVHCLLKYTDKELLVGTDNGLYLFNQDTNTFRRADNPADPRSLSDQTINGMMWDVEGALWVLTNLGGINYMSKQTKRFDYYSPAYLAGVLGAGEVVAPFCENKDGNIWIGTQSGLYFFNATTRELSPYAIGGDKNQKYDIRSLMLDGDYLWVGTYAGGIRVVNLRTGAVKSYTHSRGIPNTICSNDVLCIYKGRKGDIYVGTGWGLCRYNPVEDNFMTITSIGSMVSVVDIYEDMYNHLWIATSNSGVFSCNTMNAHWRHYRHEREDSTTITSNSVITLFEDAKGTMWFGTNGGGLCSFDAKEKRFIEFDPHNTLLPNKVIYAIEQDQGGDFWISSNAGIFKINPVTKEHSRQFTINDGLQGNQFIARSSLKSSEGKIYFGGINGFNVFQPEQFVDNEYIPPVYVTDIRLPYQTEVQEVKKLLQLDKPLYLADKVTLSYENNSFSIRFVALSFEDPGKNRYSYILRGVDKEWIMNTDNNIASYTNLPPGEYLFEVRGSNNDCQWNENTTTLKVVITPPWWRSTFAYVVYVLLLLGWIVWMAWRWNLRVKRKYKRRMEKYQIAKEQEVYKSKISFFINLVHEIRTPLSLICLPLEKLLEKEREGKDVKYLSVIDKNVNYLLSITNELLDFQKMESGTLHLNLKNSDIKELVNDVYNQFTSPAELKGIDLQLILPEQELTSAVDREKLSKILVNLMGNAIKYAHARIDLKLLLTDGGYEIRVNDDGPGIPDGQKLKIFEPFYQLPDDKTATAVGTGIGLAYAKTLAEAHQGELYLKDNVGGGSSFILSLPMTEWETGKTADIVNIHSEHTNVSDSVSSEYSGKKFTVLLVEDNVDLLNLIRESLTEWFRVLRASNGREALEVLAQENVDVIVSDVMMPEMDGLELCCKVKSEISYSHIPVILLTAKTTLEAKVEGLACGADVYIEKPFSVKQLRMQIENLLKLRQSFHKLMVSLAGDTVTVSTTDFAMSQKDCEFVTKIQGVIAGQLADENFSIDTLAEQMNMSRSNFYRKIKALSGMSPNDYLKTLRMNKAAELIMSGIRIAEVAAQVGFTSSSYFAKCFKAQYGVLPKEYAGQPPVSDEA